jgi:hypothetical protein
MDVKRPLQARRRNPFMTGELTGQSYLADHFSQVDKIEIEDSFQARSGGPFSFWSPESNSRRKNGLQF